jgi:hypothetical protein
MAFLQPVKIPVTLHRKFSALTTEQKLACRAQARKCHDHGILLCSFHALCLKKSTSANKLTNKTKTKQINKCNENEDLLV